MQHPSPVTQESNPVFDLGARLGRLAFDPRLFNSNPDSYSSLKSNSVYFDSFGHRRRKVVASLSLSSKGSASSSISRILSEFNRAIKFHCDRIPIGFASVRVGSSENNGLRGENGGVLEEEGLPTNGVENENPKKVLILMSDTGGGHRASAEAIKAAFHEKYGEEYQVSFG